MQSFYVRLGKRALFVLESGMSKKWIIGILLALIGFSWAAFLTENLPFNTMDDMNYLYQAKANSFPAVLKRIANPLTPTWTYQFGSIVGDQRLMGLRPVELLSWKVLLALFHYDPAPYYLFKALWLGIIGVFIFGFILFLTRNTLISFLAGIFYCTTLPNFMTLFYLSDFGLLAQIFQAAAITFFLLIYFRIEEGRFTARQTLLSCLGLLAITLLGIKTYETIKILPPLFLGFLFLKNVRNIPRWLGNSRQIILLSAVLLGFLMVVPITTSFQAVDTSGNVAKNTPLVYHWDTVYRFLIQNTRNAWETEGDIAFFSLKSYLPFSIARTFGFFLCWLTLFSALWMAFKRNTGKLEARQRHTVHFLALWALANLVALGLPQESDGRHLMAPLIPFTIGAAFLITQTYRGLSKTIAKIFVTFGLVGWVFATLTNMNHDMYFRKFLGGVSIAQEKYMPFIYKDDRGSESYNFENLMAYMRVPEGLCIWNMRFIVDDLYGDFSQLSKPEKLLSLHREFGKAYLVTQDEGLIPAQDKRYVKLGSFDQVNKSLYSRWVLRFKKKKAGIHHVYKFIPIQDSAGTTIAR
ncbi:MAG: hypothetical protein HY592_01320 [Candidatus Omnitrophica bacterium]|nr:hypothetical protein [Candidatus Omnitrophota bacterium]